jgi:hypothetical protein
MGAADAGRSALLGRIDASEAATTRAVGARGDPIVGGKNGCWIEAGGAARLLEKLEAPGAAGRATAGREAAFGDLLDRPLEAEGDAGRAGAVVTDRELVGTVVAGRNVRIGRVEVVCIPKRVELRAARYSARRRCILMLELSR